MNQYPNYYYQIYSVIGNHKMVLDIFNRGRYSFMPHLVSKKNFSGHYWQMEIIENEKAFKLTTTVLGVEMWLDTIDGGIFDGLLIAVPKDKYSNRLWKIEKNNLQKHSFKISTFLRGELKYIDLYQGGDFNNMPYLSSESSYSNQYWGVERTNDEIFEYTF
ncbi:hypothetical protein [Flavobacterium ovatum]|uniref:hypothetical protein n=1 Tax=Flavobacterium ovatum TaxID=1928857 RepID=UPI0034505EBD